MTEPRYEIVVHKGDDEVSRHVLAPGDYFIGTSASCAVPVPVDAPGRKFTRLSISRGGNVLLEDLESENGTMLDGLPIVIAQWQPGHLVRFGNVSLELWAVAEDRELSGLPIPKTFNSTSTPAPVVEESFSVSSREPTEEPAPKPAPAPAPPQPVPAVAPAVPHWQDMADAARAERNKRGRFPWVTAVIVLIASGAFVFVQLRGSKNSAPTGAAQDYQNDLATDFYHQARQLVDAGQYADALEKIRPAIEIDRNTAEYHYLAGNILESQFRMSEALAAYEQALVLNPNHKYAQQNRDLCTKLMRDAPAGVSGNQDARQRLAALMAEQGRETEAKSMRGK